MTNYNCPFCGTVLQLDNDELGDFYACINLSCTGSFLYDVYAQTASYLEGDIVCRLPNLTINKSIRIIQKLKVFL